MEYRYNLLNELMKGIKASEETMKRGDVENLTIQDLIKEASEKRVRIEMVLEPADGGGLRQEINVEPWKPFKTVCPYGKDV